MASGTVNTFIRNIKAPIPSYTGSMQLVEYAKEAYYAKLLTSGILTFPRKAVVDVFLVGSGGDGGPSTSNFGSAESLSVGYGGGGGYTLTALSQIINAQTGVSVHIGAMSSEATTFNNLIANGGETSAWIWQVAYPAGYATYDPANGGSGGGGSGGWNDFYGNNVAQQGTAGGSDGSDGIFGSRAGRGQGTTTRAFNGDKAIFNTSEFLFAGGGGAGSSGSIGLWGASGGAGGGGRGGSGSGQSGSNYSAERGANGEPNTGGGGGGSGGNSTGTHWTGGGYGGSGIVIVRWGKGWSKIS